MLRFLLALDLRPDPVSIAAYEAHHRAVWPEVLNSLRAAGITRLEIYRIENRLCMLLEAGDDFSFERKSAGDASNPKVQAWETLMGQYQQPLATAQPGEKWLLMDRIFVL